MAVAVPAAARLTCPRCKGLRPFVSIDGGVTQRCGGCEWQFVMGTPTVVAPGVPATGVNATNTTGTIIAANISANGATITAVNVNAVQVGTTAGLYLVPAGGTINIAYTVATPTWNWALPALSGAVAVGALALPVASGGTYLTAGMQLLVDTGANMEAVLVGSGSTGTSAPIPAGFAKAHGTVVFGQPALVPSFNAAGEQAIPVPPGWGF